MFKEQVEKYFTFDNFIEYFSKISNSSEKEKRKINLYHIYKTIKEELESGEWHPKSYSCFFVKDPAPREIFSPYFDDRIVHHLLVNILYKIDENFIDDSYANRKGKGTHKAIKQLQYYTRQYAQKECFYMQCDIKSYFVSIDKKILVDLIEKQMGKIGLSGKDKEFAKLLLDRIILQDPTKNVIFTGNRELLTLIPKHKSLFYQDKDKGRPIGSLTSQFESLIYLNELDWYIKDELDIKHYIRYVDDFVILANNSKEFNEIKNKISVWLKCNLKLELHPKKFKIQNISKGVDFLGYIIRPHYLLVRKRTVNALKDKLRFFNWLLFPELYDKSKIKKHFETNKLSKMYRRGEIEEGVKVNHLILNSILQTINSYYGIFGFANSHNLRRNIYTNHFKNLKEFFIEKNSFGSFVISPNYRGELSYMDNSD